MIAFGWTLTFYKLSENDNYQMIILLNILVHLVVAILTLIDDGEHHKYHDYQGVQGFLLVMIRVGFFIMIIIKTRDTKEKMPK